MGWNINSQDRTFCIVCFGLIAPSEPSDPDFTCIRTTDRGKVTNRGPAHMDCARAHQRESARLDRAASA